MICHVQFILQTLLLTLPENAWLCNGWNGDGSTNFRFAVDVNGCVGSQTNTLTTQVREYVKCRDKAVPTVSRTVHTMLVFSKVLLLRTSLRRLVACYAVVTQSWLKISFGIHFLESIIICD